LLIEVPNVDESAEQVRRRGATFLQEVRDWPWRFRDFKLADPCGNIICLFSRLPGWEAFHGE
jgi:predicted enzyme related to lactoylglutathione lyase